MPPLHSLRTWGKALAIHPRVPQADRRYIGYGVEPAGLPYRIQDNYNRQPQPARLRTAVLENEQLRATFLLDLGGRLWSLIHRPTNRELLANNPIFQPANLAVRNAWFSGGVEWNVGVWGHTPLACSPVFAARLENLSGNPVLRLYEYERARGVPFQLDCWLSDQAPLLLVRGRVINPHAQEIPMYWWSNIAVPESSGARVLVPAQSAFSFGVTNQMNVEPIPHQQGVDLSYPTNHPAALDFFFRMPQGHPPWIASLDADGAGLFETSTMPLKTRKLFVWGMNPGGRRWQRFLSNSDVTYAEIQAGLAPTQSECVPMPAHADWSWLEAFGLLQADPQAAHDPNWKNATTHVGQRIEQSLPHHQWLQEQLAVSQATAQQPPDQMLHTASGWGALEQMRRSQQSQPPLAPPALPFAVSYIQADQIPWRQLLCEGIFPARPVDTDPGAYLVGPDWRDLLAKAIQDGPSDHWYAWYHLGVMHYHAADYDLAHQAWLNSIQHQPSAWAYRNLAVIAKDERDIDQAAQHYLKACTLLNNVRQLIRECGEVLIKAQRWDDLKSLIAQTPQEIHNHGRIKVFDVHIACHEKRFDHALNILNQIVVPDIREGETLLSDLWWAIHQQSLPGNPTQKELEKTHPVPAHLDFRMTV